MVPQQLLRQHCGHHQEEGKVLVEEEVHLRLVQARQLLVVLVVREEGL